MKKILFTLLFLITFMFVFGQNRDEFGYSVSSSLEAGGPSYYWHSPSTENDIANSLGDDDSVGPIPIGFNFDFYGNFYDELYVNSNGILSFGTGYDNNSEDNQNIPFGAAPNNLIAWFWDDLNPTYAWANPHVYYETRNDDGELSFVITFMAYPEYGTGGSDPENCIQAQVKLYQNGNIKFDYQYFGSDLETGYSTIGIENATGTDACTYIVNNHGDEDDQLENEMAVLFTHPEILNDDLEAISISGDSYFPAGQGMEFAIEVFNRGLNSQDDFDIIIKSDSNIILGIFEISEEIPSGSQETILVELTISSGNAGQHDIYAEIDLDGDEDESNDITDTIPINVTMQFDMEAINLTGPTEIVAGYPASLNVIVKNNGALINNYDIQILNDSDQVLNMVTIDEPLGFNEQETININVVLEEQGTQVIRAKVVPQIDLLETNNETNTISILVNPPANQEIQIGSGDLLATDYPWNYSYWNSLTQTIYYADEINVSEGFITSISYQYNFAEEHLDQSFELWIAETTVNQLQNSWLPVSEFTQVFSGNVDFQAGEDNLNIIFDEPFERETSNNICLMVRRNGEDSFANNNFYYEVGTIPHRSREYHASGEGTEVDLTNLPTGNQTTNLVIPNTIFYVTTDPSIGHLTGQVTDENGAVAGAEVSINNSTLRVLTDNNGMFYIQDITPGLYDLTVTKVGYYDFAINELQIVGGQTTNVDIDFVEMEQVAIVGRVIDDATINGVADINVSFASDNGIYQYSAITNDAGNFILSDVYAHNSYTLTLSRFNYETYTTTIEVDGSDMNLGDIEIAEIIAPVSNVEVDISNSNISAEITWELPNPNREISSYKVSRLVFGDEASPENWIYVGDTIDLNITEIFPTDITLTTYKYAVVATYNNSEDSEAAFSAPFLLNTPLYPITDLTITMGAVDGVVNVDWTSPGDNVDFFRIYLFSTPISVTNEPHYQFTNLTDGNEYSVGVAAVYSGAAESEVINADFVGNDINLINKTALLGNYPNPFKPSGVDRASGTTISWNQKEAGKVSIDIYNMIGQKVKTLVNEEYGIGEHNIHWNGKSENQKDVASGVYFYRMKSGKYTATKKMIILK